MSFLRWTAIVFLSAFPETLLANSLANSDSPEMPPVMQMDFSDTRFCRDIRDFRESSLAEEPNLNKLDNSSEYRENSMQCFSPAENLFYSAHQEAEKILGPHAVWYTEISNDFRHRLTVACQEMRQSNNDSSKAFDYCVESRHDELMGPYKDKYQREKNLYLQKRQKIAQNLVDSCDMAISIKRNQLPGELEFPIAYHDDLNFAIPNWLLEKNMDDKDWLASLTEPKIDKLMHDVLGSDCPGSMVYWVVYKKPGH